jgi:CheY-like chemotaxis protein/two-component sensor histidine kinase
MEAIGTLAGGIAHDFNNILTAVTGFSELLRMKIDKDDSLRFFVDEIHEAGQRGASLTHQILAFSRKQVLDMRPIDINEIVRGIEKMLHRLVRGDIEIELMLYDSELVVMADASQIDQVLINLATNARDAMPGVGKLRISTEYFVMDDHYIDVRGYGATGEYALMTVSDTGSGMNEETRRRIFEPFFTTKSQEKGTGLGLAMVYGIIQQSGGDILVYSEPGKGTTFKIFLPRVEAGPAQPPEVRSSVAPGKGGSILVVEDDIAIRELARQLIEGMGYHVAVAANGGEALILMEEEGLRPDLLITDVVMPGMSGRVLVQRLLRTVPDLKVIYMSGYTDDTMLRQGVFESGITFLQKPFCVTDLAAKINSAIEKE